MSLLGPATVTVSSQHLPCGFRGQPLTLLLPHCSPTLTLIPSLPQQGVHTRWGLSDRAGVRLGSPQKGFTQLCLPRSLLLVTQSPSGQGRCYRPLVKVRFSTKAQLLKRKKRVWCSETVSSSPQKERWEES